MIQSGKIPEEASEKVHWCLSVCTTHAWCLQKPEKDAEFPGAGVSDSCESPRGCWELCV